jgi:tetratricopeptide (TPR) repeat protein
MGTLHYVVQLAPRFHWNGAALRVRPGQWDELVRVFDGLDEPRYLDITRAAPLVRLRNTNVDSTTWRDTAAEAGYLLIGSGGKWGYGDAFRAHLAALCPYLEDARWCVFSEDESYLEVYANRDGALDYHELAGEQPEDAGDEGREGREDDVRPLLRVALAGDTAGLRAMEIAYLDALFDDALWDAEILGAYRAHVDQLVESQPNDWQGHFLRGRFCQAVGALPQAAADLEIALVTRPGIDKHSWGDSKTYSLVRDFSGELSEWVHLVETKLGHVYMTLDAREQARLHLEQASNLAPRPDYGPLNLLAALHAREGALDQARTALDHVARHAWHRRDLGTALYNRACLCARAAELEAALEALIGAIACDKEYRARARQDPDLASLRERNELRLLVQALLA